MIPGIQYLASSGKRMECQIKARNEQPLKHILSIRIFDIFLEREEFHFLYFSSCIYVRHTLKESSFLATKGLLFLIKKHSKYSKYYCWNCGESYHQGFKAFPNVDNSEKFIFCLVQCYLIQFSVKISHVYNIHWYSSSVSTKINFMWGMSFLLVSNKSGSLSDSTTHTNLKIFGALPRPCLGAYSQSRPQRIFSL